MKFFNPIISSILLFTGSVCSVHAGDAIVKQAIYTSGEGYHTYRIPALLTSAKGTLMAFAEGRESQGDSGNIDIVLRRSEDGGKSWKPMQVIMDDGSHLMGNPSALVDQDTSRIYLMFCGSHHSEGQVMAAKGTREVLLSYSDDDGLTWSPRRNISAMAKKPDWRWYAIGPCTGIQIQTGRYKGRLVFPVNHSVHYTDGRKKEYRCHSLYSDDHGETWKIGTSSAVGGSETQIAEVQPDLLLQDIRMQTHRKGYRAVRFSSDGGATWTPLEHDRSRVDPKCQGSVVARIVAGKEPNQLYSSNPAGGGRNGMTVYSSTDGGKDWQKIAMLHKGPSAYSDLTLTASGELACLYEAGEKRPYESIVFETVPSEN